MTDPGLPRRALVLGLARTGQAVARVLAARGVAVTVADRRPADALPDAGPLRALGVVVRAGEEGPALVDGADLVVPSPGVPAEAPALAAAVARGIPVWSEIELASRLLACPVVAITGTNGKSTTTSLVGRALERSGRRTFTGGNLGTPLVAAVDAAPEVAVAEVSSFQLEWVTRFRPRVAALLNLTPNHLDRHPSFAAYRDAKARCFAAQTADDVAVVNRDDPEAWALAARMPATVVPFGAAPAPVGAWRAGDAVVLRLPGGAAEERYPLARTRLRGRHNVENVMAAALVARLAGATPAAVQEAIDTLEPLPHRLALVAERAGVRWVDDSKATNAGAAARSVEAVPGPVILLAGGLDKAGGYDALVARARGKVRLALAFGAAREAIAGALAAGGVPVEIVTTLGEAVRRAAAAAAPGDTVLLAPACASFDQFTDYAARGRAFRAAVEALP